MVIAQQQLQIQIQQEIKNCSVKLSEVIERGSRLDASYYDVQGKKIRQFVENCTLSKKSLNHPKGFANIYYMDRFKRMFTEEGIPIYTSSQILESIPKAEKFISSKTKADLEYLTLKNGQIVMTRSGTIGKIALVGRTLNGKVFSDDLLRIECYDKKDVGYLYAFMKSKIGQRLITTNNYGSVITHIEPEHFTNTAIPEPNDKFKALISEQIWKSIELRDGANELIQKAINLLEQKFGIASIKELKPKYFISSDIKNYETKISKLDLRFDASYHTPLVDEIINQIKKLGAEIVTISDKRVSKEIILPGRFKRRYVEEEYGIPFLGGKDIMQFDPVEIKYLSLKEHGKRIEKELLIQENMVLITRSGTVGNVFIVPKHLEKSIVSEHVIRIIPSDTINPGYVYAFLASDYGYELIIRNKYGSVVDELDDHQVGDIVIPLLSPKIMNQIGDMILEANKKRTEAYLLEKESIKQVEELIKNNQK